MIENLRQDKMVKHYLEEFYTNEHTIELIYDEIFQREREKNYKIYMFSILSIQKKTNYEL